MKTLTFLISTIIELYTMALLLRIWMQWVHCNFYNPLSQFIIKITQPSLKPLHCVISPWRGGDSASILLAFFLSIVKAIILFTVVTFRPIIWIAAFLILAKTTGILVFWVLVIMGFLNWITEERSAVQHVLLQLTQPLLNPIRSLLPLRTVDFSPMILVLLLCLFNIGITELFQLTENMLLLKLWITL